MKRFFNSLLSLGAPILITAAIIGFLQREGSAKFQCLPALFVGSGLIINGAVTRRNRRKKLLLALRDRKLDN